MASFVTVTTGLPGLDNLVGGIRLGDNVVWQLESVSMFSLVARAFVRHGISQGRRLIYFQFGQAMPLLSEIPGLTVHVLDPSQGFEGFTSEIHRVIESAGIGAYYVFDCLSELQEHWASDNMMANFFLVTCPRLFELDTVAFFPILRNNHGPETMGAIRDTTQILLDYHSSDDSVYIHPLKVWKRYGPTMFLPHWGSIEGFTSGASLVPSPQGITLGAMFPGLELVAGQGSLDISKQGQGFGRSLDTLVGNSKVIRQVLGEHLNQETLEQWYPRVIGTGNLGGKAWGLILARTILGKSFSGKTMQVSLNTGFDDTWFVGAGIFYTFLVINKLWKSWLLIKKGREYHQLARDTQSQMLRAKLPKQLQEALPGIIAQIGDAPLIVRASSLLGNGFNPSFPGRYPGVFCPNQGTLEQGVLELETAIKEVYASILDEATLAMRQKLGYLESDEQIGLIIQVVHGSRHGNYLFPSFTCLGFSDTSYCWSKEMDPHAGMIQVMAGLGTREMGELGTDYPRLVGLKRPDLEAGGPGSRLSHGQGELLALDLETGKLCALGMEKVKPLLNQGEGELMLEHGLHTKHGVSGLVATGQGLISSTDFLPSMDVILQTLQTALGQAIELELSVTVGEPDTLTVDILQCKPIEIFPPGGDALLGPIDPTRVLFDLPKGSMGPAKSLLIDSVVYVDINSFMALSARDRAMVSQVVGKVGMYLRSQGKVSLLLGPGPLGTTSGLSLNFMELQGFSAFSTLDSHGALSSSTAELGSGFFLDMVKAGIVYIPLGGSADSLSHTQLLDEFGHEYGLLPPVLTAAVRLVKPVLRVYASDGLRFVAHGLGGRCRAWW